MRIFNTICKKCGKQTDEDMAECMSCGSKAVYYQADLTKKEIAVLTDSENTDLCTFCQKRFTPDEEKNHIGGKCVRKEITALTDSGGKEK